MGRTRRIRFARLTERDAFMPEAINAVQRPIIIRAGGRPKQSRDWLAVLFDRRTMIARYRRNHRLPDEGYLHVLIEGCLGVVGVERQEALSLQEPLRCRALELAEECRTLQEKLPKLLRAYDRAVGDAGRTAGAERPSTAAECYESPEAIARRRGRERAKALRDSRAALEAARRRLAEIRSEHAVLEDTFWFHEGAFVSRAAVVHAQYRIRMEDFARRTLHSCLHEGETPILPDIPRGFGDPAPFPQLPDAVPGERSEAVSGARVVPENAPGNVTAPENGSAPEHVAGSSDSRRDEAMRRGGVTAIAGL